jgi:hypothetical protein
VRRSLILAATLALASAVLAPVPTDAAFPGASGRILISTFTQIASAAPDGSDVEVLLTTGTGESVYGPTWSPGGRFILYAHTIAGNTDIWRMDADGSARKRLTTDAATDTYPAWSPDGSRFAFQSDRSGNDEIYTMRVEGGDLRRLTNDPADDIHPAWSPDNERIAFASNRRGHYEIHVMHADGSGVQRVSAATADSEIHAGPEWSADGTRLAYNRVAFDESWRIHELTVATGITRTIPLTSCVPGYTGDIRDPHYAPDSGGAVPDAMLYTFVSAESNADVCLDSTSAPGDPAMLTDAGPPSWYAEDWQPIPAFPLVDARFSPFKHDIEWAYDAGITVGCSVERYCPADPVTREQMASFLVRALGLTGTAPDAFDDDDGSIHEHDIDLLAEAGITAGCGPASFCPKQLVKRDQMASFLDRAVGLPATSTDYFSDDEGNTHEAAINRLRAAGITTGCAISKYCPAADVTRGQMAAFLHRTFD